MGCPAPRSAGAPDQADRLPSHPEQRRPPSSGAELRRAPTIALPDVLVLVAAAQLLVMMLVVPMPPAHLLQLVRRQRLDLVLVLHWCSPLDGASLTQERGAPHPRKGRATAQAGTSLGYSPAGDTPCPSGWAS